MNNNARKEEELATQRRAGILQLKYIDTSAGEKTLYPQLLSKETLYQYKIIPIYADENAIQFGVTNTTSKSTMERLAHHFQDQRITFGLISDTGFREYMKLYDPPKKIEYETITLEKAGRDDLIKSVSATLEQVRADDVLGYLVQQAHLINASDIHLENAQNDVGIRFRIDGVLQPIARLTKDKYRPLLSTIASAGNISTASETAQQGHIAQTVRLADSSEVRVNVRLESVQTIHGMDVVLRLFNMSPEMYQLDKLQLSEQERKVVDQIITKPSGLVLIVGPTGSGKTTTLYSMITALNAKHRKIITIEDPVEYQLDNVTQIPLNTRSSKDVDFAESLRGVLRLDPDVVMIGEIRDLDTARTAFQAALTGHLVLATFHAATAAAALTRMAEVIGNNPLFVSSIRLVMAQRLVRRLDDDSKIPYQPDEATLSFINTILQSLPQTFQRPTLDNLTLYKPGSSEQNPYGYRGQIPLREQFTMQGPLKEYVQLHATNAHTDQLEKAAVSSGMKTMLHDGILKVLAGETTMEELYRVIG